MTIPLPLAATLYCAGFALVVHRGTVYALRGRAMVRCPDLATAATGMRPELWGVA